MALYTSCARARPTAARPSIPADAGLRQGRLLLAGPVLPADLAIYRRLWLVLLLLLVARAGPDRRCRGQLAARSSACLSCSAGSCSRWRPTGFAAGRWNGSGYRLIGVVEGRDVEEAEMRFFAAWRQAADAA